MKFGEVYGAISKRLNRGISYICISSINEEVECNEDDIKEVTDTLCQNGLARCITKNEYELICDIGQLRDFTIKKQNEGMTGEKRAEPDSDGDKPVSLESVMSSEWKLKIDDEDKKEKERLPLRDRIRRSSRRTSLFDDDDDDENDEEARGRIIDYLKGLRNYNEEERSFEPEMRIMFPGSDTPIVLEWATDEDGDIYLTDRGALYNYLLSKMIEPESDCAKETVLILISQLVKSSSFSSEGEKLINYLTGIKDVDRVRIEISYFAVQFGKYLNSLSWLLKEAEASGNDPVGYVNKKIEDFIKTFSTHVKENIGEYVTAVGRIYVRKIFEIDPRITRKQAIETINAVKKEILSDTLDPNIISGINDAVSRLNIMSDRMFAIQKLDAYIN